MAPTANVVATLEPDTAAKIMQVMTQDIGNPPLQSADDGLCKLDEPPGNPAGLHDVAGEDEQRQCQKRLIIERLEQLLGHDQQ